MLTIDAVFFQAKGATPAGKPVRPRQPACTASHAEIRAIPGALG